MSNQKLNILIYPMLSVDNINADSNYIIIKQVTDRLAADYNFFLLLDKKREHVNDLDPRVKVLYMPMIRGKIHQVVSYNQAIFREILLSYPIDIIWNNVVEVGHHLKRIFGGLIDERMIKVLNFHHYIIHKSLEKSAYDHAQNILGQQLLGSMLVDLNYFHSQYCFDMLHEEAVDFLSPAKVKLIEKNSYIELGGYCDKEIPEKKYDKFTFVYNHRLDGYKDYHSTFDLFDRLHKKHDFQVVITGGDQKNIKTFASKPYVMVKSFRTHADYLQELSRCHANTTNSLHETYCIAMAESIVRDHVVVAPYRMTFPELLHYDYPYLYKTREQQYMMLDKILTHDMRSYQHQDKERLYADRSAAIVDNLLKRLAATIPQILPRVKQEKNRQMLLKLKSTQRSIGFRDAVTYVWRQADLHDQSAPPNIVSQILRELGFEYSIKLNRFIASE